jgi:hypothetical protein
MNTVSDIQRMDWTDWLRGVIGAGISGGAGSIASGVGASMADPAHDVNVFKVMWITFAVSAAISLSKYLALHPVPDPVVVATVDTTTVVHPANPSIPTTETTTHTDVLGPKP